MCDSFDPYFNSISTGNSSRKSRASTNPPTFHNSISTAVPTPRPVLPSALPRESGHLSASANPSTLNPFINSISTVPEKRRHYLASENLPTFDPYLNSISVSVPTLRPIIASALLREREHHLISEVSPTFIDSILAAVPTLRPILPSASSLPNWYVFLW